MLPDTDAKTYAETQINEHKVAGEISDGIFH
jgi:hypothetical protein